MILESSFVFGQGAKFSVNSQIGCDPFTVVVTDLSGVPNSTAVNYDYGDGSPLDSIESYTYSQPGVYRIIQTVANANPRQDTIFVEVINQFPPEFFLFNCKGTLGSVFVRDTLYEAYEIYWGDGTSETALAYSLITHDYGTVSSFNVTVKGLINGSQLPLAESNKSCYSTSKRLNMIDDILPATLNQMQVLSTDPTNGSISIAYSLTPGNNYLIEIKNQNQSAFTIIDTINQTINPTDYILRNLNTQDNYYCVSITAFDPCDGDVLQSNIGCSINLTSTAENQVNQLEWQTNTTDFQNYRLFRDGSQLALLSNPNQVQYADGQVICGIEYAYQLRLQENNSFVSISDISTVKAISTEIPDPIENISVSVSGQDLVLNWEQPQNYQASFYVISRSSDESSYTVLDTLNTTTYTDKDLYTQSTPYYYKILYFDACNNQSATSIIANPILLIVDYSEILNWSDYEGWINGIAEYILEKYDESGQLIESLSLGNSTSFKEDELTNPYQYISYLVRAIPNSSPTGEVLSNILVVIYKSKVAFPNAFSPNGDGSNDIFNFKSRYISAVDMKIFNRWGEPVFQTYDIDQGWNGNFNGKPAPPGAYIHHTKFTDDMGITFTETGEIILIR